MNSANPVLVTTTRGPILENRHRGAAAIVSVDGGIIGQWGDVATPILPRSAIKMIQALPLIESGASAAFGLNTEHLALACASHQGAPLHTEKVAAWLSGMDLSESDLLCGPQPSRDRALRKADVPASRIMNNCSGKHTGFLALSRHLNAPLERYLDPAAPVQSAIGRAFAEMTGCDFPLVYGIDGCSAPNFAASIYGVAAAMALFANPSSLGQARAAAAIQLREAMCSHPLLISGEGRACAALIGATEGRAVVKTGADGVYTGIITAAQTGFCLKIDDGNTAAAEALCAGLLIHLGALDPAHPAAKRYAATDIVNFNNEIVGARQVDLG